MTLTALPELRINEAAGGSRLGSKLSDLLRQGFGFTEQDWQEVHLVPSKRFFIDPEQLLSLKEPDSAELHGTQGVVLEAVDTKLNRPVKLKVMRPDYRDEYSFSTIAREARLLLSLDHPNIVKAEGLTLVEYESQSLPAIILEKVDGPDLRDFLKKGFLSASQTIEYLRPIAEAMDYCHDRNILNKSVMSKNIVIDKSGRSVLVDFGVAFDPGMAVSDFEMEKQWEIAHLIAVTLECLGVDSFPLLYGISWKQAKELGFNDKIARVLSGNSYSNCVEFMDDFEEYAASDSLGADGRVVRFYAQNSKWRESFGHNRMFLQVSRPNDLRLSSIDQLVSQFSGSLPDNAKIIDLGFGPTARDIRDIQAQSKNEGKRQQVFGAELVFDNIRSAWQAAPKLRGRLTQGNINQSIPIGTGLLDGVLINSVIQYIPPNEFFTKVLPEVSRILKPGGDFLLILKSTGGENEFKSFFDTVLKTERAFWFYNPDELITKAESLNLELKPKNRESLGGLIQWTDPFRDLNFSAVYLRRV